MKILFAADGSKYTKKALAFLVTHESLASADDEIFVLNVQTPVPLRFKQGLTLLLTIAKKPTKYSNQSKDF
jgi:hypothetical protein